jgi:hypothetical protein
MSAEGAAQKAWQTASDILGTLAANRPYLNKITCL